MTSSTKFGTIGFSNDLMQALRSDNLVVFAGAGVSVPEPSNLPNFTVLLQDIQTYFQVGKSNDESVDQFLGRLEAGGHNIRAYIADQLKTSNPNQLHNDLLDIRQRNSCPKLALHKKSVLRRFFVRVRPRTAVVSSLLM